MDGRLVIEADQLTKEYSGQKAVDGLDLKIHEGEIFGFLGPNGAGKTTTILMLLGLTEPTAGRVRVLGCDPNRQPLEVKRSVGYLQENMGFYNDLNARQMLSFIAELNSLSLDISASRIESALQEVGLADEAGKPIGAYSRGMRQRLGIAEILLKEPRIAVLDEPTLGLDPDATNRMMDLIDRIRRERKMTVVLSSHLLHQAQKICRRVGIMIKGRMVAQGTMDQLAEEKLGIGQETYTLEEVYMKYFKED
jgi:ABC-2 type transport system ATP-binding protein